MKFTMKHALTIGLLSAVFLLSAQTTDLIKDGTFKEGNRYWKLHRCSFKDGKVVFNNKQPTYVQFWQVVPITLPAGTKLRLEADIEVTDPYDVATEKGYQSQLALHYHNANKKTIWGKNKPGVFPIILPCEKKKTFVYTSIVPEGTVYANALINSNKPIQLKIHAIRLIVEK